MDKQWVACRRTATTGILTVEKLGGTTLRQQPHCHNTRCRAACPIDGAMPVSWCSPTQHCIHAPMHQCTNAPTSHARLKLGHVHCCAAYRRGTPASSMHYNQEVLGRALVCVHENFQNPQWLCQNRSRRFVLHSRTKCLPHSVFAPWPDCRRCSNPTEGGNRTPSHSRYAVVLQSQLCGCVEAATPTHAECSVVLLQKPCESECKPWVPLPRAQSQPSGHPSPSRPYKSVCKPQGLSPPSQWYPPAPPPSPQPEPLTCEKRRHGSQRCCVCRFPEP